jgi:RNA polymerase sporulation-specific sigma factor
MSKLNEKIIEQNEKLVYKIASEFGRDDIDDLYQVGMIAIENALANYDENCGIKFSTYAFKWVRGGMLKYVRENRNIKVRPDNLKIFRAYKKAKEFLEQRYFRTPSFKEIAEFMGTTEEQLYQCLTSCEFTISLDEKIDEDRTAYEVIGEDYTEEIDEKAMLKDAISDLSEFEKKIINLRIYQDRTQSETARVLGINQVQVSRYEKDIISRIRKKMEVS